MGRCPAEAHLKPPGFPQNRIPSRIFLSLGVLTPEELPAAIAALKTEMEKEKEYLKAVREREDKLFKEGKDLDEEKKPSIEQPVYFTQRAYPLLEMFELSLKDDTPVVWGV